MAVQLQEQSSPHQQPSHLRVVPPIPTTGFTILGALQWLAGSTEPVQVSNVCSSPDGGACYPYNVLLRDRLIVIEERDGCSCFHLTDAGRAMIAAVVSLTP